MLAVPESMPWTPMTARDITMTTQPPMGVDSTPIRAAARALILA